MNTSIHKNIFTFFSNGQNINSIKNKAKKEHKAGKYPSRSSALNSISKEICGKPFNKAVKDFELTSPYSINDTLYLPLTNDGKKYIVTINNKEFSINKNFNISFPEGVYLSDIKYDHFEKLKNGWIFTLSVNKEVHGKDLYMLQICTTDEGIIADLWVIEEVDFEDVSTLVDSTAAMYDEVLAMFPSHFLIDFKINTNISDMMASIQLNHKTIDESTTIAKYENNELLLCGCVKILTPEGQYLYGENVLSIVKDGICSKKDLMDWMENNAQIKALDEYEMVNNPWFTIVDEDGEPVVECFDSIPESEFDLFKVMNPNNIIINTHQEYINAQK